MQMKMKYFTTVVIVFLFADTSGLYGQKVQGQLDQIELMKQFLGTWSTDMIRTDTSKLIVVINPYGSAMECSFRLISGGKSMNEGKWLWGYNPEYDKFIAAEIMNSSPELNLFTYEFISKNIAEKVELADVADPDPTLLISRFEFKSPDLIVQTVTRNNKLMNTFTITRVKN